MLIRPVYRPRMPSLANGLLGWLPFDDGILLDKSGFNYNGSVGAGTVYPVGGIAPGIDSRARGGLHFDGSAAYIALPSVANAAWNSASFSVAAWVKPGSVGVTQAIVGHDDDTAGSKGWVLYIDTGNLLHLLFQSVTNTQSTGTITGTNRYTHCAATYDGSNARLYINGVLDATVALAAFLLGNTGLKMGANGTSPIRNFWTGSLDDVRYYNRVLSPGEVRALHAEAFQPQIDVETISLLLAKQQTFLAAWAMQRNQISQGWAT